MAYEIALPNISPFLGKSMGKYCFPNTRFTTDHIITLMNPESRTANSSLPACTGVFRFTGRANRRIILW
jgi:hypothetical protein